MVTRGRVLVVLVLLAVGAVVYTGWSVWQVKGDLDRASKNVQIIRQTIDAQDPRSTAQAVVAFQQATASADDRTSGWWWGLGTHAPVVGDDASGIRALVGALDIVAQDGLDPVLPVLDDVDKVVGGGRINLRVVRSMQQPLKEAEAAFSRADEVSSGIDSSGFIGLLRTRFDEVQGDLSDAASGLRGASTAVDVLPGMAGGDGPRDYLLIFQNNAEIRATGGLPGSWALVHAEDGVLEMRKQGNATAFPLAEQPVLPLTDLERNVYGQEIGTYFQDPGFAPDFPRAAELWNAHWQRKFPDQDLDGVMAIDPVALSYLLPGTGPVEVAGRTLSGGNLVDLLLNQTYIDLEPDAQDAFFQEAARNIFDATTRDLESPLAFVQGLQQAATESRFLVAPFEADEREALDGTTVAGGLSGDDGSTPHVDVGLNDGTTSKMSYYLRYQADVQSLSCDGGTQQLAGSMMLRQDIAPSEAAQLPQSVTGSGRYGTERGTQLVAVRLYGPVDGTIFDVRVDGKLVDPSIGSFTTETGRDIVGLGILLDSRDDVAVTWSMTGGPGQSGDGEVGVTPSVVAGDGDSTFASTC